MFSSRNLCSIFKAALLGDWEGFRRDVRHCVPVKRFTMRSLRFGISRGPKKG
jgi:hypothetical protein